MRHRALNCQYLDLQKPAIAVATPKGFSIALLSAVFLSTTAIFIRYLSLEYAMPPLILAFWRDLFAFVTMLPILTIIGNKLIYPGKKNILFLVAYGFLLAVFNVMWTFSVVLNGAAVSTVLVYSSAGFTVILGRLLLKETISCIKWIAVATSLGGCIFVSNATHLSAWTANSAGILTGIASGLCYAVYSLMGRYASHRGLNPWTTVLHTFGYATIVLLFLNMIPGGFIPGTAKYPIEFLWLNDSWSGWLALFALAAGPTVLGYGLYTVSLAYLSSGTANLIVTLEPVFTAIIARILFDERLTGYQLAGAGMIIAGVVLLRFFDRTN